MVVGVRYKILFAGLGSIGQRHLENIISILKERNIYYSIDALRTSKSSFDNIDNIYTTYNSIPNGYDITFITNPTNLHYSAIQKLKNKTKNLFIEKPIFNKYYQLDFTKGINYVACPLRFHPIIKKLKTFVEDNNVFSYRAIASSYLPEWRKNSDYTKCYSASKKMGGGVHLDLIHEIDYLKWIFGKPNTVSSLSNKVSSLQISSNDISVYIFKHKNVVGSLHLDYFGRYKNKDKRDIEIFTNDDTIIFDITNNSIKYLKNDKIKYLQKEDIYINEMNYFLDLVSSKNKKYYNMPKEALDSLKIAIGDI